MRLPGTGNHKADPVPVRILSDRGPRELKERYLEIVSPVAEPIPEIPRSPVDLHLSPEAKPPIERLEALKEENHKFRNTLERQRPDLGSPRPR